MSPPSPARQRHRSIVDVHLILRRAGRILLLRRANTGYGDGRLHLPSGHLERDESVVAGVIREAREEVGVVVEPAALRCVHVMHRADPVALPADTIAYPAAAITRAESGGFFSLHAWEEDRATGHP